MFFAFFCLLMLCGIVGVLAWLSLQKVTAHMRKNPTAAKLVAEHVIAPLLMGVKRTEGEESPKDEGDQRNAGSEELV